MNDGMRLRRRSSWQVGRIRPPRVLLARRWRQTAVVVGDVDEPCIGGGDGGTSPTDKAVIAPARAIKPTGQGLSAA